MTNDKIEKPDLEGKIDKAIETLLDQIRTNLKPVDQLQQTQAVLNMIHVKTQFQQNKAVLNAHAKKQEEKDTPPKKQGTSAT